MLDAGLSLEAGWQDIRSVSPMSSHSYHASTSSTPGHFILDGRTSDRFTSSLPPRPHSSPPSLDMAIRPSNLPSAGRHGEQVKTKPPCANGPVKVPSAPSPSPAVTLEPSSPRSPSHIPSLSGLAQSLRQRKYLSRRRKDAQSQLRSIQIASARISRQLQSVRSVQRTLAECIKSEDKASFSTLCNTLHDSLTESLEVTDSELSPEAAETTDNQDGSPATFLSGLSPPCQEVIVDLLGKIRHDGVFIADALAALTQKELVALLPNRTPGSSTESIFGATTWSASRTSRLLGYTVDSQMDQLSSMAYGSPLELLIHGVRGLSGSLKYETQLSTDVWSTVCARLLIEQKPGSEKLVPAVLDTWAASAEWPGKKRLEVWMLETLQLASFLTDQPGKQTFKMRMQTRQEPPADDQLRTEAFYVQAVNSLLELLADSTGPAVIPQAVLEMCSAITQKMRHSPGHQRGFAHFIVLRWLFSPFFFEVLTLPEAYGMMLDCYIPENVRNRVFREIAGRAQKAIFNVAYPWRHGVHVPIETSSRVQAVMDCFDTSADDPASEATEEATRPSALPQDDVHLVICASDVVGMVNALFPVRRPASFSSEQNTVFSGLQSSASSVSGFSLFRQPSVSESPGPDLPAWSHDHPTVDLVDGALETPSAIAWDGVQTTSGDSLDPNSLREACAELEDVINAAPIERLDRWATLVIHRGSKEVHAASEEPSKGRSPGEAAISAQSGLEDLESTVGLIEEMLLEDLDFGIPSEETAGLSSTEILTRFYSQLRAMLQRRIASAHGASDFLDEFARLQNMHRYETVLDGGRNLDVLLAMLLSIQDRVRQDLLRYDATINSCELQLAQVEPYLDRCMTLMPTVAIALDSLRDKMWYVADVRTSAAYDEARGIVAALKVMGIPKQPSRTRLVPPLRHLSSSKISSTGLQLKSEVQILELLSTVPSQGGPNKLSDEQSRATSSWMERNSVENLCRGEERLHKLCMEVKKCADQLMASDGAMIWCNPLFAREKATVVRRNGTFPPSFSALEATAGRYRPLTLHTNLTPSIDTVSSASHPLSNASSKEFTETRSPALTSKSSMPFWSPAVTEAQSPSSATSVGSIHARGNMPNTRKRQAEPVESSTNLVENLRLRLMSLLLSDLGSSLFNEGCETDKAFFTGLGGNLMSQHWGSEEQDDLAAQQDQGVKRSEVGGNGSHTFDFGNAFVRLLQSFSACCDPSAKLNILYDINQLLLIQVNSATSQKVTRTDGSYKERTAPNLTGNQLLAEKCVDGFRKLFSDSKTRPRAVFRDLQYIAALVPTAVLENTAQGRAFWNAAVAISRLKQEARDVMVETADNIIAYHSNNRGHGRSSSTAQQQRDSATFSTPSRTPSAEDIGSYSMADAAYLLQITAKEGDPAAQRELATLYLTHPELMDHIIAPFARPKDVFKDELESKWRKNQDPNRCDPTTMCVAHHWMSLSSRGGDALAKEYLRQREEMERLP